MSFRSARLKLTIWYLLIVISISILFSILVYRVSFREITIFNRRQAIIIRDVPEVKPFFQTPRFIEWENLREQQLNDAKHLVIRNLILTNLLIFIAAGILSYLLAKRTLKPIEEMIEIQDRFTSDASHELRTPLAAMKLENEVALRDKSINLKTAKKVLKSNLEEIDRLEQLSNSLLKLSQLQNGQLKINPQIFPFREIIELSFNRVKKLAELKKINLETKISSFQIEGSQSYLAELFTIILDNAIKYSPNRSTISIECTNDKNQAILQIKDRGIGIGQNDLPYIFDRFYRADQSRSKEKFDGYGLGLSIAKQIVELHHGSISVESEIDKGATFIIKLPIKQQT